MSSVLPLAPVRNSAFKYVVGDEEEEEVVKKMSRYMHRTISESCIEVYAV